VRCYREGAASAALLLLVFFATDFARAQYLEDGVNYAPDKIVVAFEPQYSPLTLSAQNGIQLTGIPEVDNLNRQYDVTKMTPLFPKAEMHGRPDMAGYYSLIFGANQPLEVVLGAYDGLTVVDHVEPVGIHRVYFNPNDPYLGVQWAITKIDARQAWDVTRGDSTVPLGIADTGVDWNHPDLDGNIWYNFADPVDGSDNDDNGYIDDIRGWDWVDNESGWPGEDDDTPDNNPMDFYGHGTHVAGIASAETNNSTGVAGVGFNCSIMCLRIGWMATDGFGYVEMSFAASAFYYAANEGAKAINCSWGSYYTPALATAASYASSHGVQIVSAAGNDNNDTPPYLCTRGDVIAVAATNQSDHKADFSSYGSWVDVSAPGVSIYSTYFDNTYAYLEGTSMAAPHVTGLAGLIKAVAPYMSRAQIQAQIINTTEDIDGINPGYEGLLGSGRINAYNAVEGLGAPLAVPIPVSPIGSIWINAHHPTFVWMDTADASRYHLQVDQSSSFPSPDINDSTLTDTTYVSPDSLVDGTWYWRVRAGSGSIWTDYCSTQSFRIDTRKPNTPTLLTPAPESWINDRTPYFSWQSVTDVGGSGVAKYYIEVDGDSTFTIPYLIKDSTLVTNYTPSSALPADARTFWRIRARDNAGNYGLYGSSVFNLDNTAPGSPIGFNVDPDGWTSNPDFTLDWTNPADASGISMGLYKVGPAPVSNYDTTGHFGPTPPVDYFADSTGSRVIYLWLVDGAGNASFLHRSQDTIRFDNTPPSGCVASSLPISSQLDFTVQWTTGADFGSGLAGLYDIRYKDGSGGVWTDWLADTTGMSAIFNGLHGHTYYFEARTKDNVGNLEPFIGTAECQTEVDTTYIGPQFIPGDANGNGEVNGVDVVYLVNYLKGVGPPPPDPILRADANGNCEVNGVDVVYLVNYLKGIGPAPVAGNCR